MKTLFRKFAAFGLAGCMAVFGCLALSGCGSSDSQIKPTDFSLVEQGKLTVGSDLDFPPMEYLEGNSATGFGIAMIEEVGKRIGLEVNVLPPQNFDTLITQVAGGANMDVAVSSMTITPEREQQVAFSTPYFDSNLAVVVDRNADYAAKEDLDGKTVGVQSGSSGEAWAKENLKKATIKPYNGPSDALAALRSGDVEAVIYDEPVAQNHVTGEYTDCKILETIATGEQYGIAINRNNTALIEAINGALADMESDGTMARLKKEFNVAADSE